MANSTARKLRLATPLTLEGEKKALLALRDQGEDVHWQMGWHYNNIIDNRLAEAAGYKSARRFFSDEIKFIPISTLSLYAVVAKAFEEEIARHYGVSKLGLLITLRNITKAGPAPADPGDELIEYTAPSGSKVVKKFSECSVQELNRAIRRAKGDDPLPPAGHLPDSEAAVIKRMMAALPKRYPQQHIVLRPYAQGNTTFFTLENVPLAICEDVFITLQNAIWWNDDGTPIPQGLRKPSASRKKPAASPQRRRPSRAQ